MTAPILTGDRVLLRTVEPRDQAARQALGWHALIERNYGHEAPDREMTAGEAQDWYSQQRLREADRSGRYWVIETAGQLAGVTFLHSFSAEDRKAWFAIGLFHPVFLGRGLGSEATRLVLRHAFTEMGLNRVDLRVLAFNESAIAAYQRCGFVVEGRERESCWIGGRCYDDIIMGVLARELRELS